LWYNYNKTKDWGKRLFNKAMSEWLRQNKEDEVDIHHRRSGMTREVTSKRAWLTIGVGFILLTHAEAALWHYRVPFESSRVRDGQVLIWLPPRATEIRGLLIGGRLGIELEIALHPLIRKVCEEERIAIVYFDPHISATFKFWEDPTLESSWLKAIDDLAERTGHPEIRRVPWITMGHSTAGIFARNVAYRWPSRTAGVLHIKSGNFHQRDMLPPGGSNGAFSLVGVPLLAINGQFEEYGPEGGLRPEWGRETQWVYVVKDILRFREKDPKHLMSLWVEPGGNHHFGSPEFFRIVTLFIRKTAQYRLPKELPMGNDPIVCQPLALEDGWVSDASLDAPRHPPAPYREYTGDRLHVFWHYDEEMAKAHAEFHRLMNRHQCLSRPQLRWLDEGDGWLIEAEATFLDRMPEEYGGRVANMPIGHASGEILYLCRISDPVQQVAPNRFRLLRPMKSVPIAAYHPGDAQYRPTIRWATIPMPAVKGATQTIEFPQPPNLRVSEGFIKLEARASSGLPIYYEVNYGPVIVKGDRVIIDELPVRAKFPIECKITAWQMGRRIEPPIQPAEPVSRTFLIVP
jgi:hypothetical protein